MLLTMYTFVVALSVGGRLIQAQNIQQDSIDMAHAGRTRRRFVRPEGLQLGGRSPPVFESRQQKIIQVGNRELGHYEPEQQRKLNFDENSFWEDYMKNFNSMPTPKPTNSPTKAIDTPSDAPTYEPSSTPSYGPSYVPSPAPSSAPVPSPTLVPTPGPTPAATTSAPTPSPFPVPTNAPVPPPTMSPSTAAPIFTNAPVQVPTDAPVPAPTDAPVPAPTDAPVPAPTDAPVPAPTDAPVPAPTDAPVPAPTDAPVPAPTDAPVPVPTDAPVTAPTDAPVPAPTDAPVTAPTDAPVTAPTDAPVPAPTDAPVPAPTDAPVPAPTDAPVPAPTDAPVPAPTDAPVPAPTDAPVPVPTDAPVPVPTQAPVVLQAILPVALQGGVEFADPNSCQSQALARTEEQVGVDMMMSAKIIQYYALYCIFTCTNMVSNIITESEGIVNVPGWIVTAGWESNNIDPCSGQWFGISCANDQVTDIDLFSNLLTGSFPAEVTLLAADGPRSTGAGALTRIDLFDNMLLTNDGDNSWWALLGSSFGFLFFKDTAFSGPLGRLPDNIREFDCSFSFISGGLTDANIQGLNQLIFADFDGNAYNSTIPQAFSSLQSLTFLYIVDGFVSGDLSYMIGMPAMREHWVDTNPGLGGTIPAALSTISTLESFSITSCNFVGTLPPELGNFGFVMRQMWMYDNALMGTIPTQLGQLSTMRLLQLEGNAFTGAMPAEICANTVFPRPLEVLGADCFDENFSCDCCTCCSVVECPV